MPSLHTAIIEHGSLKDVPEHLFTEEALNYKDKIGRTVWHNAAICESLKYIPKLFFTEEALAQTDLLNRSVWYYFARHGKNDDLPVNLLTRNALTHVDKDLKTVLHSAAIGGTLKYFPQHFLTDDILNIKDRENCTFLHLAAIYKAFHFVPKHLLTEELLNQGDKTGNSVWDLVAMNEQIKHVPQSLITKNLLKNKLFGEDDKAYINKILLLPEKLDVFIKNHSHLEKDIIHRDPRFDLTDVGEHALHFKFDGIAENIVLMNAGVFINGKHYKALNHAGVFLENNYPDVEKSIVLPVNNSLTVEKFVL